jgi:hypothetical protein
MIEPQNELGVIVAFAQSASESGFEIVRIGAQFPDATIRRGTESYEVEFEFASSSFRYHGHDPRKCDLVVCWSNDGDCGYLPVVALSDPGWYEYSISMATMAQKEATYWQWRAEKAEYNLASSSNENQSLRDKLQMYEEDEPTGAFICDQCGYVAKNQLALNGHKRAHSNGNGHREPEPLREREN